MIDSKTIIRTLMASVMALMLFGCVNDMDEQGEQVQLQPFPYSSSYTDADQSSNGDTRSIPDGYSVFSSDDVANPKIAIYLADPTDRTCSYKGDFIHQSDGTWTSSVYAQASKSYFVYGFMPSGIAPCSFSDIDYTNGGATLTFTSLSAVTSSAVNVIVGVKKANKDDGDIQTNSVVLKPGAYSYKTSSVGEENYMYFLLDHFYSQIKLQFAVDADYYELRTIKIREVKAQTLTGPKTYTAKVTLTTDETKKDEDEWRQWPMKCELTGDGTDAGADPVTLWSVDAGTELPAASDYSSNFLSVNEYCTPGVESLTFNVTTKYDVYDKSGNCVRKDCTATNKITITKTASDKSYTIKMLVKPTYLYQLSNPDLDNPTIVAN